MERPHLHILLDGGIVELATDQTLHVENGSLGVNRSLVLRGIADHTLLVVPRDVRRSDTVTLRVGDNLYLALAVHTHARVGRTQINTNHVSKALFFLSKGNCCESDQSKKQLVHHFSDNKKI